MIDIQENDPNVGSKYVNHQHTDVVKLGADRCNEASKTIKRISE